jgi:hypothetical protein
MGRERGVNVVRRDEQWAVIRDGAARASGRFGRQRDAIARGRGLARRDGAELRIQGRDGRWRDADSFGHNPSPPVDRRH